MLFCSTLCAGSAYKGYSSDICIACECDFNGDIYTYMHYKMREINHTLVNYELEGAAHKIGFDYHVGYLHGQHEAYRNLTEKFKQP